MDVDLFGRPIPENWGKPGRPPHVPMPESRTKVMLCLADGWPEWRIAGALGISEPTLRKHYFRELRVRAQARDAALVAVKEALFKAACSGNVGAQKEWLRRHDQAALAEIQREIEQRQQRAEPKAEKLGKKEQRLEAAQQVAGVFAPPTPPLLIN